MSEQRKKLPEAYGKIKRLVEQRKELVERIEEIGDRLHILYVECRDYVEFTREEQLILNNAKYFIMEARSQDCSVLAKKQLD